jgi:hypothetical protein
VAAYACLGCGSVAEAPAKPKQYLPAASPAAAPADLLRCAPPGTWGAVVVDLARLRESGAWDFRPVWMWLSIPQGKGTRLVAFVLPALIEDKYVLFRWAGLLEMAGGSLPEVQEECLRLWGQPQGEPRDLYGSPAEGYAAVVGKQAIAFGPDALTVSVLRGGYSQRSEVPLGPELQAAIGRFAGQPVYGGFVVPGGLKGRMPEGLPEAERDDLGPDLPEAYSRLPLRLVSFGPLAPWLGGGEGSSGSFGLGSRLRAHASFVHASADEAQQAYTAATQAIAMARERIVAQAPAATELSPRAPETVASMFDSFRVALHGSGLDWSLDFGLEEWEAFLNWFAPEPFFGPHHETWQQSYDRYLIYHVGLAIQAYADENGGEFPPSLEVLYQSGYVEGDEFFISPVDGRLAARDRWRLLHRYEYLGPLGPGLLAPTIICYTRKGIYPDGRNILRADGAVEWVYETGFHNPEGTGWFDQSYRYLIRARGEKLTEEQKARAREFYEIEE